MKTTLTIKKFLVVTTIMLVSLLTNAQIHNTRYGTDAFPGNTGHNNSAFGHGALNSNAWPGGGNTAVGAYSLTLNSSGSSNTAVGDNAMGKNIDGSHNTAIGYRTLFWNSIGIYNTATGEEALYNNTSGQNNSAYGIKALYYNTTGFDNCAYGVESMRSNSVGFNNAAFGTESLRNSSAGLNNSAFGTRALMSNSRGQDNTAVGMNALYGNTLGNYNIAIGSNALYNNDGGNYNTVVGAGSGRNIKYGDGNTIIGSNVTGLDEKLTRTIILADGYGTQRLLIDSDGKTRIGESLTMPGTYRLYVKDGILTEKVVIAVANSAQWADYVFAADYKLMPLTEVAQFVMKNNHLPNVPSANEIVESGINLGQMDAKLLEKIEELTLYLIEQQQKNEALLKEVSELKSRITKVEARRGRPRN